MVLLTIITITTIITEPKPEKRENSGACQRKKEPENSGEKVLDFSPFFIVLLIKFVELSTKIRVMFIKLFS